MCETYLQAAHTSVDRWSSAAALSPRVGGIRSPSFAAGHPPSLSASPPGGACVSLCVCVCRAGDRLATKPSPSSSWQLQSAGSFGRAMQTYCKPALFVRSCRFGYAARRRVVIMSWSGRIRHCAPISVVRSYRTDKLREQCYPRRQQIF